MCASLRNDFRQINTTVVKRFKEEGPIGSMGSYCGHVGVMLGQLGSSGVMWVTMDQN